MPRSIVVSAFCVTSLVLAFAQSPQPEPDLVPVLVELFTSEGCSSCPPADDLLIALDEQQFVPGAFVIALSQHVEYWNGEWSDPFSHEQFTERQRAYHPILGSTALFTPEMVVDGRMQFVGSQRMLAEHAIARAIERPKATIGLTATTATGSQLEVRVSVSDASKLDGSEDLDLWLAVAESGLETDVPRGENARRRLRHAAVVRSLERIDTLAPGLFALDVTVSLAPQWMRSNLRVVAFLQEPQTRHIRGVGQLRLDSAVSSPNQPD